MSRGIYLSLAQFEDQHARQTVKTQRGPAAAPMLTRCSHISSAAPLGRRVSDRRRPRRLLLQRHGKVTKAIGTTVLDAELRHDPHRPAEPRNISSTLRPVPSRSARDRVPSTYPDFAGVSDVREYTVAPIPCNRHCLICRKQSCSQDMRYNTGWRFGRGTVEGYRDTQRTYEHRGRENERYHGNPLRSVDRRERPLGELAPALTDRRIDGADQALHAPLVT
jgi:hypothetical protein